METTSSGSEPDEDRPLHPALREITPLTTPRFPEAPVRYPDPAVRVLDEPFHEVAISRIDLPLTFETRSQLSALVRFCETALARRLLSSRTRVRDLPKVVNTNHFIASSTKLLSNDCRTSNCLAFGCSTNFSAFAIAFSFTRMLRGNASR